MKFVAKKFLPLGILWYNDKSHVGKIWLKWQRLIMTTVRNSAFPRKLSNAHFQEGADLHQKGEFASRCMRAFEWDSLAGQIYLCEDLYLKGLTAIHKNLACARA